MKCTCQMCSFRNPKGTSTAIIIKDNKLLLLKRSEEPFLDHWDLPGGFMQEKETPEESLRREMKEELGIENLKATFIKSIPGYSPWGEEDNPIVSNFFLVETQDEITINEESKEYAFVDLKSVNQKEIAFDSNQNMVSWVKEQFTFDLSRVKELTRQLDSSAIVHEQSLYKAILDGFVSRIYEGDKLIGMGWIFPRQTMLRRQAVVEDMIVDNDYRGKGYGKKMLLELLDWAKQENMDMIELTSNPARIAANELYKKVGFTLHPTNHYLYKC